MTAHSERHFAERIGWLRASVLGANDGIISTASLLMGLAAAATTRENILIAGVAGLVAGAMSMAAGEYVSVSSQSDSEQADLERERRELAESPEHEHAELAGIYEERGLDPGLADQVAEQLMQHDALGAHARDELGLTEIHTARPVQAAVASAIMFAIGAALPLFVVVFAPASIMVPTLAVSSLVFLAGLGGLAGVAGGAKFMLSAARVTFWGALAMAFTAVAGKLFGAFA